MKTSLQRRFAPLALAATLAANLLGGATISQPQAFAQPAATPQNDLRVRTQNRIEELFGMVGNRTSALNLSAAQKAKLKEIARKNAPLAQAVWNNKSLSMTQKQAKAVAIKREMAAVLTPAQKQLVAASKREAVGQLIGTASWISGELNLSLTQQNQAQQILSSLYRRGLTQVRAATGEDTLRSLILSSNSQFKQILTPSQQAKWAVIQSVASEQAMKRARFLKVAFNS